MLDGKSSATDDPKLMGMGANGYAIFGTGSEGLVSTLVPQNQSRMQSVKDESGHSRVRGI